jgi:signal transduction histidine kinase
MTIIGSLIVYMYAQRQYNAIIEKDYHAHWETLLDLQRKINRISEQDKTVNSLVGLNEESIRQQLLVVAQKCPQLFRVTFLDTQGNLIWGKESKEVSQTLQHAKNVSGFHEQVHLVQLPLIIRHQHVGFLRGEFSPIDSGTVLVQITKITLQIAIGAAGLMILSGGILIVTQITKQLSLKQQRLEKTVLSLEKANESLRKTRKDLQVSEKLASLGYLAAGIAHEIGNPLGSVLGYIELLQKNILDQEKAQDILLRTEKEIERIRRILQELVSFSRPHSMNVQTVDINKIVRRVISQFPSDPEKSVEFELQLTEFPLFANVDEHKVQSVFFNIIRNGMDAISPSGRIRISTSRRIRESSRIIGGSEVIAIQCSDTGSGIPEEDLSKVFDPFFTTKEPGGGMGLGLSLSHRIIESLNGEINIQSVFGKGTDVTVFLPPARKKEQKEMRDT